MSGVWIDGMEYKGASVVNLALESEVQKHPVEKGFSIADNIKYQSPQFKVSLTLGGAVNGTERETEYNNLKTLRDKGALFTFICDLGSFSDMVIQSISPAVERSVNTFSCELTIVQIRQATLVTRTFEIPGIYSPTKPNGTPSTQAPQENNKPEAKEAEHSWLYEKAAGLCAWVAGLF